MMIAHNTGGNIECKGADRLMKLNKQWWRLVDATGKIKHKSFNCKYKSKEKKTPFTQANMNAAIIIYYGVTNTKYTHTHSPPQTQKYSKKKCAVVFEILIYQFVNRWPECIKVVAYYWINWRECSLLIKLSMIVVGNSHGIIKSNGDFFL